MMRAGGAFTFGSRRYESGDLFDVDALPEHQRPTFVRLYGLTPVQPSAKPKSRRQVFEAGLGEGFDIELKEQE